MLKAAEMSAVRFHDMLHTAVTLLLALGVGPRTNMETLGHTQISLTLNTNSHVLPSLHHAEAHRIDAVLGSP